MFKFLKKKNPFSKNLKTMLEKLCMYIYINSRKILSKSFGDSISIFASRVSDSLTLLPSHLPGDVSKRIRHSASEDVLFPYQEIYFPHGINFSVGDLKNVYMIYEIPIDFFQKLNLVLFSKRHFGPVR